MENSANDRDLMRFDSGKVERVDAKHHGEPQDYHCIRDRFASSIPSGSTTQIPCMGPFLSSSLFRRCVPTLYSGISHAGRVTTSAGPASAAGIERDQLLPSSFVAWVLSSSRVKLKSMSS